MLSKETFHPLGDVKSVPLMEGQVSMTLDFFFFVLRERSVKLQFES